MAVQPERKEETEPEQSSADVPKQEETKPEEAEPEETKQQEAVRTMTEDKVTKKYVCKERKEPISKENSSWIELMLIQEEFYFKDI